MKTNTVFFVFIVRLLFYTNWTYGEVHLSAKIAENADIGQQVFRVLPTTPGANEEVLCDITDGNVHGRFSVTHYCVIVVARPLDFSINQRYNLTVNVPGTTETSFVDIQVEDVDGYPPIYNDTCEMPVLGNDRPPGHLAFNALVHAELEFETQPVGCPPSKYGLTCEQNCTCENGARCHGLNGACKCQPGWKGVVCDIPHSTVDIIATPSDSRRIHNQGSLTLHCKSFHLSVETMIWTFPNGTRRWLRGTQEDQIRIESIQSDHNGTYTCTVITENEMEVTARYELQAVNCPPDKGGEMCEDDCNCLHDASCDRWAGCICPPGWTGNICETKCPDGTYGRGCNSECPCQNGAVCDPTDGQCNCTEGWYGVHCSRPCLSGRYGWRCRQACECKNNATCHHVDGICTCVPPWTGQRCDVIQPETSLPLQISLPLSLTLLGVLAALVALYKWRTTKRLRRDENQEETQMLLELKSMEENLAQSLQPGSLKRWERKAKDLTLGDLIGQGAFSFIREGRLRTSNADVTVVAVKSVRSKDRLCYRAFYRDAAMLVALDENGKEHNPDGHPNIIKLLGVITRSTPKCILLEYAANGDLLQLLKQQNRNNVGRLQGRFLCYAIHISSALKELRRLRITHGDVAARNVLISGDDVAKLSDFGLAHDVYTTTTYISSGKNDAEELLPLKWMSLESLETRKFTCESDMWSFGVLLWEIAAFGEEPDYQHEIQLSCPRLVGILRQGYRLQKPLGCPDRLYDVMKSCWQEDSSARPEPAELEQKLTDCREEIDPLFFLEKTNIVLFVIVRLLAVSNFTYGEVHLSAKIAENADIGHQVISVLPTTPRSKEEVLCDIIDGNIHGRFGVTHYCVIVVARPLDFGINLRYNLTVNVPWTTETSFVDIQVEDVDGYPPVYNDTCEMPVLAKDIAPGHLAFNMAVTMEYMEKSGGLFTWRADTKNRLQSRVGCPPNKYGLTCEQNCTCEKGARCHGLNGACKCQPGWKGVVCDIPHSTVAIIATPSDSRQIPLRALLALYKWRTTTRMRQDEDQEETQVLLELKSMEENLAQSLQPGWLKRWERKAKDLTLGDLIGQGAFSFIREGRLRTANADVTVVAVKSVRSKDRLCYRAFYREAAMLVALDENCKEYNPDGHPNIIKLFGVITKSTPKCILLEYAAKGDLLQLMKQQPRNNFARLLGSFLRYAVHISRALKELRRLRIAHGDVAARNVLISRDVAKLSDFGLAHDVYTTTTYISSGKNDAEELLPLKWMALESLETCKFTCESDTWSFGVLLWEIAAFGEEPDYQHEIQLSCPRLVGILRQGYRLQKPPGCPDRLYDVMKSCWQEDPSARPEPVELEQKLTDCLEEIDPLFVIEKVTTLRNRTIF
ncbi:uncharacterized protein LOC144877180 [Branchiostoma floridae x Branchiostoma japonicum]